MGRKVKVPKVIGVRVELEDCLTTWALMFSNAGGASKDVRDVNRSIGARRGVRPNLSTSRVGVRRVWAGEGSV